MAVSFSLHWLLSMAAYARSGPRRRLDTLHCHHLAELMTQLLINLINLIILPRPANHPTHYSSFSIVIHHSSTIFSSNHRTIFSPFFPSNIGLVPDRRAPFRKPHGRPGGLETLRLDASSRRFETLRLDASRCYSCPW